MLHLMTVTESGKCLFRRNETFTRTTNYLLNWEGVKRCLNATREVSKRFGFTYSITLAIYHGQPFEDSYSSVAGQPLN